MSDTAVVAEGIIQLPFHGYNVRSFIDERDRSFWAQSGDVGEVLGYTNIREALTRIKSEWKRRCKFTDSIGRQQEQWFINEQAITKLAFRSEKLEAEEFTDKIADIVTRLRRGELQITQRQLVRHRERATQVQNVKDVAARKYAEGGVGSIIEYHMRVCEDHTGMSTTDVKKLGLDLGLKKTICRSAREVIRATMAVKGAQLSIHDQIVALGYSYDKGKLIAEKAGPVFEEMERLGMAVTDLQTIE